MFVYLFFLVMADCSRTLLIASSLSSAGRREFTDGHVREAKNRRETQMIIERGEGWGMGGLEAPSGLGCAQDLV